MELFDQIFIEPLRYEFMQRALLAALLVGTISSVVGCYIIVRRLALLGDAIAHAVLPGVALARLLDLPFFWGAVGTGVLTALGIGWITRRSKIKEDTAIGVMFTTAFALGVLLLSTDAVRKKAQGVDLFHVLFGNVLGVSTGDLVTIAIAGALVLLTIVLLYKELLLHSFDPTMAAAIGLPTGLLHYLMMLLLSLTIVASLQTVGVVLAVAMLIIPGATAFLLTHRLVTMMLVAALLGVVASLAGLYLSFHANLSSGAAMVLAAGVLFMGAFLLAPQHGVLARQWHLRRHRRQTQMQDLLRKIYELTERGAEITVALVAQALRQPLAQTQRGLRALVQHGWIRTSNQKLEMTPAGREEAIHLIRSHRLWERYLAEKASLPLESVHAEAHRLEHVQPAEMAERLERQLGHPVRDPHGDPIPTPEGHISVDPGQPLDTWPLKTPAMIVHLEDEPEEILSALLTRGLTPGQSVLIVERNEKEIALQISGRVEVIPTLWARAISVVAPP
ncbi:MAG: metal ABC transporter permease [Candidatus Bipolaricaulota bacterium]|nr:metal ABC transporter permease [Candidatus Bipolaricaulota bacterium]MCS7274647.1 metal ABC transporter permease [Candidatus Bipolaricaulota bacterium]MDW8110922.1 metal ABC transporter permease [Candidatus Bipolaricaulota bacterium]MDW8329117.1 metal ABC transporter permease [Candidatus Bipolaricaulota bacterium]